MDLIKIFSVIFILIISYQSKAQMNYHNSKLYIYKDMFSLYNPFFHAFSDIPLESKNKVKVRKLSLMPLDNIDSISSKRIDSSFFNNATNWRKFEVCNYDTNGIIVSMFRYKELDLIEWGYVNVFQKDTLYKLFFIEDSVAGRIEKYLFNESKCPIRKESQDQVVLYNYDNENMLTSIYLDNGKKKCIREYMWGFDAKLKMKRIVSSKDSLRLCEFSYDSLNRIISIKNFHKGDTLSYRLSVNLFNEENLKIKELDLSFKEGKIEYESDISYLYDNQNRIYKEIIFENNATPNLLRIIESYYNKFNDVTLKIEHWQFSHKTMYKGAMKIEYEYY